jgi:hypothetical protein
MDASQSSSRRKRWLLIAVTAALLCLASVLQMSRQIDLQDKRQWVRQLTAFQILVFEPEHEGAKMLLRQAMKDANPPVLRTQADRQLGSHLDI